MKFETLSGQKRSRRNRVTLQSPAVVETLEVRSLLTTISLTGPSTGAPPVINDATPTITWAPITKPGSLTTSYDLWITDAEQRVPELIQRGISSTSFTPASDLNLGLTRVWVRANYADATSSAWSPPTLFAIQVPPTVIGPVNSLSTLPSKINETRPSIEWTSAPGAVRYELTLEDLTTQTSKKISLKVTPPLDVEPAVVPNADAVFDIEGEIDRQTISSWKLPNDLPMGHYRVFVRSMDDGGKYSPWSAAHNFEIAPQVNILRPGAPAFQATQSIEVTVNGSPTSGTYTIALTTSGLSGRTSRTSPLPYNATWSQVQAAVRNLPGFGATTVTTSGASPNLTHVLTLPLSVGAVNASVSHTFVTGTATLRSISAKRLLLEWAPVPGATHYEVQVNKVGAAGQLTGVYYSPNLTTTSYQLPGVLPDGNYVFWVRARRLHQVTEIKLSGTPTSGSYRIELTTSGKDGTTQQTALIPYNATAAEIKAAVVALTGFTNADVISQGKTPDLRYMLQIPQTSGVVRVRVIGSVSPGTLTQTTNTRPVVTGLWSARSDFSTIKDPVITGPVGVISGTTGQRLVTDVRPTIEWTAIDRAARYEIWIDISVGAKPYLITTSSTNSYKFEQDIQPGKYEVWVRAVSPTGVLTGWGRAYAFEATGGAPVITSPLANAAVSPIPNIAWTAVAEASSYEIWVSWVGEDFTYIVESGITTTNYAPVNPLPTGSYRVWVRAIKADSTALPWSQATAFSVASIEAEQSIGDIPVLLASLLATDGELPGSAAAETPSKQPSDFEVLDAPGDQESAAEEFIALLTVPAATVTMTVETEGLIQQLAEHCAAEEWWMPRS